METTTIDVLGMKCINCEKAVIEALEALGYTQVSASTEKGRVELSFDPASLNLQKAKDAIIQAGFMAV